MKISGAASETGSSQISILKLNKLKLPVGLKRGREEGYFTRRGTLDRTWILELRNTAAPGHWAESRG